jgi:hypothetical protein
MKNAKYIFIAMLLCSFLGFTQNGFSKTKTAVNYEHTDGGMGSNGYDWVDNRVPPCIFGSASSCCVHVIYDDGTDEYLKTASNKLQLSLTVSQATFSNVNTGASQNLNNISGFTFNNDAYLEILSSDEHPELVGKTFSLSGVTVDQNNKFTVNVE